MINLFSNQLKADDIYERFFCIMFVPDGRVLAIAMKSKYPKWICSFSVMLRNDCDLTVGRGVESIKKDALYKVGLNLEKTKGILRSILTFRTSEHSSQIIHAYEYISLGKVELTTNKDVLVSTISLECLRDAVKGNMSEFDFSTETVMKKILLTNSYSLGGYHVSTCK